MSVLHEIHVERARQIHGEGWTPEHDDEHSRGEMADAAACYAVGRKLRFAGSTIWPWDMRWWKPGDRRRNLIKAGALIVAEIERLDRLSGSASSADRTGRTEAPGTHQNA